MLLGDVAQVQPGYFCRGRVRSETGGTHYLLQARDVSSESGVRTDALVRFTPERNPELYLVSRGDILITARGQRHWFYLVREDIPNLLASSVFYVLRPRIEIVTPGYLAWWLDLSKTRAALGVKSQGTGIRLIDRLALESLPVTVPPMAVQQLIERVVQLRRREAELQCSIQDRRDSLIREACLSLLKEDQGAP